MAEKFYITAAIDYSNGNPHMGHAFEKIGVDVIARYKRAQGFDVRVLVGTDEHSQNVVKRAQEKGQTPKQYCDAMADIFREAYKHLQVSFTRFIRTSDEDHHRVVQWELQKVFDKGDIYKGSYEGFYCVSCEAFYLDKDLVDGKCPTHKREVSRIKEENYFFAMSKYQKKLIQHIQDHPEFIQPEARRNEVLRFLEEPLQDLSISRSGTEWGVRLPFDSKAVAYVWFDALTNYVTGVRDLKSGDQGPIDQSAEYKRFWPADVHVVGKDITRFHCVIWPIMLMAAGIPLQKTVWGHGFVNLFGEKMSKSTGTIIDPMAIAQQYGVYALRYFLMREIPWTRDGDFSHERLVEVHNADLANGVGNLLSRTVSMTHKYFNGVVKPGVRDDLLNEAWKRFAELQEAYCKAFDAYLIHDAADTMMQLVRHLNLLIDQKKPWAMAKDETQKAPLESLLHTCLAGLQVIAGQLEPFTPDKAGEIFTILAQPARFRRGTDIAQLQKQELKPAPATPVFPRLELPKPATT